MKYSPAAAIVGLITLGALTGGAAARTTTSDPTLVGTVGPGFTITLRTPTGKPVSKLKAGVYTVRVRDLSPIHDFHLFGHGVNKRTSVEGTGSTVWSVRLTKGSYHFVCDPHKTIMHGGFTVV